MAKPETPGSLYMIRTVQPHEVVLVRPADGHCVERAAWVTSSATFAALAEAGYAIHGSATASLYPAPASSSSASASSSVGKFVALAHLVDSNGHCEFLMR